MTQQNSTHKPETGKSLMSKTDWMSAARQQAHRERNAVVKIGALWLFSKVMAAVNKKARNEPASPVSSGSFELTKPNGPIFQTAHDQQIPHRRVNHQRFDPGQPPFLQSRSDWVGQSQIAK